MTPSSLQWWAWLLIAGGLYFVQLMVVSDTFTRWCIRAALIAGMVTCAAISVIRFVKWVWQ